MPPNPADLQHHVTDTAIAHDRERVARETAATGPSSRTFPQVVETDPAAGSFTCYLTARPPADVRIGWIAIG